ncbi:hypothetical Protein YC6258_02119 [Gynuella sunshinyii YC6258]|uniref:Uncharacterized protein n=1 Tax=Gynuella sunshinyii YC6258 TaxID=1445510 RepID=A0A0C5VHL2_9GAMM|nr:hypothetical Protein YC6258_02119 [Gynuella sunshinyii YC6258]
MMALVLFEESVPKGAQIPQQFETFRSLPENRIVLAPFFCIQPVV